MANLVEIKTMNVDFLATSLNVNATKFPIKCLVVKDYYFAEEREHHPLSLVDEAFKDKSADLTLRVLPFPWFSDETQRNSLQTKISNFVKLHSESYVDLTEKFFLSRGRLGMSIDDLIEDFVTFFITTIMNHIRDNTFYCGYGKHGLEKECFEYDIIRENCFLYETIWNSNIVAFSRIESYEIFTEHIIDDLETIWKLMFIRHTFHGISMSEGSLQRYRNVDLHLAEHQLESALIGEPTMTDITFRCKYSLGALPTIYDYIILDRHIEIWEEYDKRSVLWSLSRFLQNKLNEIMEHSNFKSNFKLKNIIIAEKGSDDDDDDDNDDDYYYDIINA